MSKVTSHKTSFSDCDGGYAMNPHREAFLRDLGAALNWVDRDSMAIDPFTVAYCAQAGWISRRVAQGVRQYRITDAGLAAMAPALWR